MSSGPTLVGTTKADEPQNRGGNSGTELIPQPHGGALRPGGNWGNRGGGRIPSQIRGTLREIFEDSLDTLRDFTQGRAVLTLTTRCEKCGHEKEGGEYPMPLKASDVTKAMDIAAKYGIGTPVKGFDDALVQELGAAVSEELDPDAWEQIRAKWIGIIGRHVRGQG